MTDALRAGRMGGRGKANPLDVFVGEGPETVSLGVERNVEPWACDVRLESEESPYGDCDLNFSWSLIYLCKGCERTAHQAVC